MSDIADYIDFIETDAEMFGVSNGEDLRRVLGDCACSQRREPPSEAVIEMLGFTPPAGFAPKLWVSTNASGSKLYLVECLCGKRGDAQPTVSGALISWFGRGPREDELREARERIAELEDLIKSIPWAPDGGTR